MPDNHILKHYQKQEHSFVEKIIEWSNKVVKTHIPILTDFVDPRQLKIINNIVNAFPDLTVFFDGGYKEAERVRGLIAPEYWAKKEDEFGLTFFEVKANNKFEVLKHSDYLGALAGIGIKRDKFGDILIFEQGAQYIIAEEIADYILMELNQIGRTKVELERINRENLRIGEESYNTKNITVSSERLDSVTSQVYQLSRSKIPPMIKNGNIKVNWRITDKVDYRLESGDVVSVRGFGRYKVLDILGETKKGKVKIKIGMII